jgi:hypothetical protein
MRAVASFTIEFPLMTMAPDVFSVLKTKMCWAVPEAVNITHAILKGGASYIMGDNVWTFNGTGTLAQLQFKIIREVNETSPEVRSYFSYDPSWTKVYYGPSGQETPDFAKGLFVYVARALEPSVHSTRMAGFAHGTLRLQTLTVTGSSTWAILS